MSSNPLSSTSESSANLASLARAPPALSIIRSRMSPLSMPLVVATQEIGSRSQQSRGEGDA
jgi:hypothetical protein